MAIKMDLFIKTYVILLGIVIGSFLNVLIYRLPLKISVSKGRSFCPECRHTLNWLDLFPLFSYLFLKGKCRYCKTKISLRYPLIELLNAAAYFFIYLTHGLSVLSLLYAAVCSCLIALAFIDIDHKIIPDRFNVIIGVCALVSAFFTPDIGWPERIIGLFAVSVPLLIIALLTGGVGEGDVKLFAVCGFLLGWKLILLAMFIASVAAAAFGISLMAAKKASGKNEIPFGPFIALAAVICIIAGKAIINFYLNLIL